MHSSNSDWLKGNRRLSLIVLVTSLVVALFATPAQAVIVLVTPNGITSAANDALPTNGTAGSLIINKPAGAIAGHALIASIAARPSGMTVTVPAGWFPMTVTQQAAGGVTTLPGGMTLLTYYRIVALAEPASYTWTFANPVLGTSAGSAVGGILTFSGIDTAASPIDVWSARLTASGLTHATTAITPTVTNTMIVSSISYLSGNDFGNPTGIAGITERLDQRAPAAANAIGTTLQMSTAPWATLLAAGPSQAIASADADTGVGHLMALKPALRDPSITKARSGPLNPGGSAFYTLTVTNNGINPEPGPLTVVDTLPAGLTYNPTGSGGAGWACGAVGQIVTGTRAAALAGGATAAPLVLNVNISAGATGTVTNSATVSGTGGDGNMFNNTATDSYTFIADLALSMSSGALNPGQNGTFTLDVSNIGTATEPGSITITDILPAGLTFVSGVGTGWSCVQAGQTVTCTRTGTLGNGAAAGTLTLTVAVAQTVFAITNTATVSGTGADNSAANNSATVTYNVAADLAISKTRGGALVPGTNATYTLSVSNAGPNAAPQPITITDTLPAGLTFVSGVGAGWTCVAGVTCTRTGALASGASSSLVLTVAVSAGASGTITNTATVSGTAVDSTPLNNTATDSYTIPLSTYAYYKMDEASWTGAAGEVVNSSGAGPHATALGSATTVAAPALGLKGDTCRAGSIPTTAGSGVSTGIDINNDIGNSGTISFWYQSNTAWNDGTDRMLFDASNNLGAGGADKHFYLVKGDGGELRFALEDDIDDNENLSSGGNTFAAGQWHHIAVTWDWVTSNRMYLYLDGVALGNNGINDNIGNYSTLLIGLAKTGITGTDTDYTTNTANGVIDEVRIYNSALTLAQVTADMNATHACPVAAPDHLEIQHASGTGLTCAASTLTIKACTDAAVPCATPYTGGVSGTLSATGTPTVNWDGTTGGAAGAGFAIASGSSTVTKNVQVATAGTVTFGITSPTPVPTNGTTCNFGTNSPTNNNCVFTAGTAGFIFADSATGNTAYTIPTLTSGTAQNTDNLLWLRAVQASTATAAVCTPAIISQTVSVDMGYACNNPGTCQAGTLGVINGTAIASAGTAVSLAFDANGAAKITSVRYDDVGSITLNANKTVTPIGGGTPVTLNGASNTFVVRPAGFVISGIKCTTIDAANCGAGALAMATSGDNPAAADAAGVTFIRAGHPFTVIVTATNALGGTTKNYGKETAAESVKLASALVAGLGMTNNPTLVNNTSFGAFTNGVATGTTFIWNEAGIITLTPSVGDGDYLGAGDTSGTQTGNVGRFYAAKFTLTNHAIGNRADLGIAGSITAGTNALTLVSAAGVKVGDAISIAGAGVAGVTFSTTAAAVSANGLTVTLAANAATTVAASPVYVGAFTYIGESMNALFTLTAKAVDGTTTLQNYNWSATAANQFAKLNPLAAVTAGTGGPLGLGAVDSAPRTAFPPCGAIPCLTPAQATAGTFAAGVANVTVPFSIFRGNSPVGPYAALGIGVAPLDSDGAILSAYDLDTVNPVFLSNNHAQVGSNTEVRFGRLWMGNAYGSERRDLTIPYETQYWNGLAFIKNTPDNHTALTAANFGLGNYGVPGSVNSTNLPTTAVVPGTFSAGSGSIALLAPNAAGSVDVVARLGGALAMCPTWTPATPAYPAGAPIAAAYLQGRWCLAAYDKDPVVRATFGVFGDSARRGPIYLRENF